MSALAPTGIMCKNLDLICRTRQGKLASIRVVQTVITEGAGRNILVAERSFALLRMPEPAVSRASML